MSEAADVDSGGRIAVIGMACKVPGASNLEEFWRNLIDGVESIGTLSEQQLRTAQVAEQLWRDPRYIRSGGFITGVDEFDAAVFGCTPREAELLDPQHRVLMECAWHALEHAGYGGIDRRLRAGVFAGVANSEYYRTHVRPGLDPADSAGAYQALISGERDFLTTRLSYLFDLSGPSVNVQCACSTSLVAVHLAAQALLAGECDLALAGGVAIRLPQHAGYLFEEGMILSRDGHCRAFDATASGTVIGNGAGMVVLRRLEDALEDGDTIHAVIIGSAVNNDGARRVGYTAPSITGQASVILEAQTLAGVSADTIGLVETHGTGTPLGDPIEVAGLTQAFRRTTNARAYCALGAVKTNIGHLDTAAGIVGFIKAVLAVSRGVIPATLHFQQENPALELQETPFYVPVEAREWSSAQPRRAGVSAFGIGGTNAHVVLEQLAAPLVTAPSRTWQVLPLSAKTPTALEGLAAALSEHLEQQPHTDLAEVAFTLALGRRALECRQAIVCSNTAQALEELQRLALTSTVAADARLLWVFPDHGDGLAGRGQALAAHFGAFRAAQAAAASECKQLGNVDSIDIELFVFEYALAALWRAWGIEPALVIGFGVGEFVAAIVSGAVPLADGARLLAARHTAEQVNAVAPDIAMQRPDIAWLCSATAQWMTASSGAECGQWLAHLMCPADVAKVTRMVLEPPDTVALAMGPAASLVQRMRLCDPREALIVDCFGTQHLPAERALAQVLASLWVAGVSIDWSKYFAAESRRRVPLPLYRFERARHWIAPPTENAKAEPWPSLSAPLSPSVGQEPRAFGLTWTRGQSLSLPVSIGGTWLVVDDCLDLAVPLLAGLRQRAATARHVTLHSSAFDAALAHDDIERIVMLGAAYADVVKVGQALIARGSTLSGPVSLLVVSEELHLVTGTERGATEQALVLGPVRVLAQEHPHIRCRNIDVGRDAVDAANQLLAECIVDQAPTVVAIRARHRWCETLERRDLLHLPWLEDVERPVFLITGGTGRIGVELASHLHQSLRARLVLVSRGQHAAAELDAQADDDIITIDIDDDVLEPAAMYGAGAELEVVAQLRRSGADVLHVCADVSEHAGLELAFDAAQQAFGRVDVVVHGAGARSDGVFTPFEELTPTASHRHFGPKVDGTRALRKIAPQRSVRMCVLMSSLSSVLGGLGFTAYAAANAYLDAVAQSADGVGGVRWLSIGWDAWQSVDGAKNAAISKALQDRALTSLQGVAMFDAIIASHGGAHALISRASLTELTAMTNRQRGIRHDADAWLAPDAATAGTVEVITSAWAQALGVESVRPDDDFYQLGGNSLLATQVVSRLRRAFDIELSVRALFEESTADGLAAHIDALLKGNA